MLIIRNLLFINITELLKSGAGLLLKVLKGGIYDEQRLKDCGALHWDLAVLLHTVASIHQGNDLFWVYSQET